MALAAERSFVMAVKEAKDIIAGLSATAAKRSSYRTSQCLIIIGWICFKSKKKIDNDNNNGNDTNNNNNNGNE